MGARARTGPLIRHICSTGVHPDVTVRSTWTSARGRCHDRRMYPGKYAVERADQPAFIMATSGEVVTYGEYEARTNRLAHLLRDQGLQRLDHYSIFMENNARYLEMCGAGERSGLYYTCINSHLTADELAYIVNNSELAGVHHVAREARRRPRDRRRCARTSSAGSSSTCRTTRRRSRTT